MGMAPTSSTADTAISIPAAARITSVSTPQLSVELTVKAFGITDQGKVRSTNEDQFLTAELTKSMRLWQTSLPAQPRVQVGEEQAHLFLVADGMGGHRAGERASAMAVSGHRALHVEFVQVVFRHRQSSRRRKCWPSSRRPSRKPMPPSWRKPRRNRNCAAWAPPSRWRFNWVRNCASSTSAIAVPTFIARVQLHQLTKDHTVVADLVRSGVIQPDEAASHKMRHVITNVVGGPEAGVKVEARALQIQPGDRVLLCSDGLSEGVTDDVIAATLDGEPDVEAAAKKLLAHAMAGPAKDNITLCAASSAAGFQVLRFQGQFGRVPRSRRLEPQSEHLDRRTEPSATPRDQAHQ